jgi:nicotinate-nucleotide adenylyltransferase
MFKICLGGSFNPIHHGHLLCARMAMEATGATGIVLFPNRVPPHKIHQADMAFPQDRLVMCRLAIEDIPGFEIDDRELHRPGPSFTIDTARELKRAGWDKVAWLIGADMVNILPQWHESARLLEEVHFIVMARPGWDFNWQTLPPSFQQLRNNVVSVPQIDVSSTEIRRRVRAGLPIDFLTPPAVCRYIKDRGLYRDALPASNAPAIGPE